jgi:uncharacterized protein YbjT (DUF2867 family)
MPYLVTGATGAVGRQIVDQLLSAGADVRAISRTPDRSGLPRGVDVVAGDFAKGEFPDSHFAGVKKVFVFPAEGALDRFLQRAKTTGVEHFVVLSSLAVSEEHPRDIGSASNLHHARIEQAVAATGIPATVLRPGTFANNLLAWAPTIKATGGVFGPFPRSAQAPIHEADVAAVVVKALLSDWHQSQVYPMTGPEALTRVEQLEAIGSAVGRPLQFRETSPEQFRESMLKYMPESIIQMLLDYWSDTVTKPDVVRSTAPITGRPARTLAQWAKDHISDFE